jgi:hypothetical protein
LTGLAVVMVLALLAVAGLVVDGARAESAHISALNEAEQAARVGAATLGASPRQGRLAPSGGAVATAEAWMAREGHPGTAVVRGNEVIASVDPYPLPTTLLSLVGIGQVTISARGSARAVDQPVAP